MTLSALPWRDRVAPRMFTPGNGLRALVSRLGRMDLREAPLEILRALIETVVFPAIGVVLTTIVLFAILQWFSALRFEPIVYLIPVVICAIRWGLVSALVCVFASALLWDFLFVQPLYSLAISDPNQIVEMGLFLFVAIATSNLAARAKNEADACRRREMELHNLFEFSRRLALCTTVSDLVKAIQEYLSVHLGCEAYLIRLGRDVAACEADIAVPRACEPIAPEVRAMIGRHGLASHLVIDPKTQCLWVLKAVASKSAEHGVLAVNLGMHSLPRAGEQIDSLLAEAGATLERIDADAALANVAVRVESEALKTALIGTASHELRSPVAAILGSASVLDEMATRRGNNEMRSLVSGMRREATRLDADIQNLLDTVRITDTGIKPHFVWTDPADCFNAAIRQRADRLAVHRLKVEIDPELPLLQVDPVLLEQAVGQVIENAAKYSPPNSEIAIVARQQSGDVVLSVADCGVGLTDEEARQLFRRAVRGRRHVGKVPGLGLGLWIAWIFVSANGGTLSAHSAGSGLGTTMSIRLPVRQTAGRAAAAIDVQVS
jgi:K+-sensing histidine kinase KdpD